MIEEDLFVSLEHDNEFPCWFKGSKTYLRIPLNKRIGNSSRFAYDNEYIGENKDFTFYMIEVGVVEPLSDEYFISIVFNAKPK